MGLGNALCYRQEVRAFLEGRCIALHDFHNDRKAEKHNVDKKGVYEVNLDYSAIYITFVKIRT